MRPLLAAVLLAAVCPAGELPEELEAVPDWAEAARTKSGTLTLIFENDTFANESDNNFTAGFGFAWTSAPIRRLSPENVFRSLVEDHWSFLPTLGDARFEKFVQIDLVMEIYTPRDITDPDPPPGDHPYAGVIAFDLGVYATDGRTMHGYVARLGLVGPATGAESVQNWMHRQTGRAEAVGWDRQLANEPLLNLYYFHQRRLWRWTPSERGLGFDVSANGGAGLGNYFIGAYAGLQARCGLALPANFARGNPMGFQEEIVGFPPPGKRLVAFVFAQVTGVAVARYLPIDGNTFQDSVRGDRDDFDVGFFAGAAVAYGRFILQVQFAFIGTGALAQDDDYAAVTASWVF